MSLNSRQLMSGAAATVLATKAAGRWAETATAAGSRAAPARGGHYSPSAAPLRPTAFLRLPPGRVTARGRLAGRLRLQPEDLCGRYKEFSHFLDFNASGRVRPDRGGWEEVPYWLRGHADLALVTHDATAPAATRRRIDAILTTRQPDGPFGPKALRTSLKGGEPATSLRHRSGRLAPGDNPFTLEGTPLTITANARRIPEWTADREHVVAPLRDSPAHSDEPVRQVTLVPMGAARLRVTSFPTAGPDAARWLSDTWHRIRNLRSGKVLGVDDMSTADSAHVVQCAGNGTDDHLWQLLL